jgi:glycosyltransferase involved in cell wall biosynthesis
VFQGPVPAHRFEVKNVKILIAAVSAPVHMNGVSRHAANLATALLQTNSVSELHFVAGSWQMEMFRRTCERADARFHAHFVTLGDSNFSRLHWYYRELPHIATQLGVDVVHFACCAPLRAGAFRCSTVVSLHDLYSFDIPENFGLFKSLVTRRIMAQCIRHVDGIACVSESTRSRLEAWFPAELHKAETICNIVEPDRCSHADAFHLVPPGRDFLLCVAQHRRNKNIGLALGIFGRLNQRRVVSSATLLVVVGIAGPETASIRDQIRSLKLESNVLLTSGLSDAQLQWCYRQCRLLLAPSITEGFGLPIAEALLAGCPVVCSDIPAFREIGGELCHYVNGGDGSIGRYADIVREVLALPRPGAIVMPHLSSRFVAQKYVDFYGRLPCRGISVSGMLRPTPQGQTVSDYE